MNEHQERKRRSQSEILGRVRNRLGFFTLTVLIIESILGIVAVRAEGAALIILIVGMLMSLLGLIVIVARMELSHASKPVEDIQDSDYVSSFRAAQKNFLQVLLSDYSLRRLDDGVGVQVSIEFDDDVLAIWSQEGKNDLNEYVSNRAQKEVDYLEKQLNQFLLSGIGEELPVRAKDVFFRFASGGTLPILNVGGVDYYSLFYREIHPIGWNIANGGSDTIDELLYPTHAMTRELSEELIIIDPIEAERYLFEDTVDRAEFRISRSLIHKLFPEYKFDKLAKRKVELQVFPGPDQLRVTIGENKPRETRDVFVNISALDLGIEVDQVARIQVAPTAILLDGELLESVGGAGLKPGGKLVNAPIGLFPVAELNDGLKSGSQRFIPQVIFWESRRFVESKEESAEECLEDRVSLFIESRQGGMSEQEKNHYNETKRNNLEYDLCPVSRAIITRFEQAGGVSNWPPSSM